MKKVFVLILLIMMGYCTIAQKHVYQSFSFITDRTELIIKDSASFKNLGNGYYEINLKGIPDIVLSRVFPAQVKFKEIMPGSTSYIYEGKVTIYTPYGGDYTFKIPILVPCKMSELCKGNWKHPKIGPKIPGSYFNKDYRFTVIIGEGMNASFFMFVPLNFNAKEI